MMWFTITTTLQVLEQPLPNVTALPQEEDIFTWHGNGRGEVDSPFTDVPFHFLLTFPQDYPNSPPKVRNRNLDCLIVHPNPRTPLEAD
jgi:ubiquitin-protein ligase